jgi:hypothetical protein
MSINEAATIQTTSINAVTPTTGTLSVGATQTTGVLNVGTGVRTSAGVMNIATGASNACAINIMNGATTAGSVNIANGTGASQTTAVNIGTGSTTGTVTIGNSANTVQVNGTLAMGTGKNITLQNPASGFVAPTTAQLGGFVSATYTGGTGTFTSGTTKVYGTITLTQQGYYLFVANCINYNASTVNPFADVTIFNVTDSAYVAYVTSQQSTTNSTTAYSLSGFYRVTSSASKTFELRVLIAFSGGTATASGNVFSYYAIRLA